MRSLFYFFGLLSLFLFIACEGGVQTNTSSNTQTDTTTTEQYDNTSTLPTEKPECEIAGQVLEGNQLWVREMELLFAIVADSTTLDAELGESHRILEVYDTKNCERTQRLELPVNVSPDYPYYLAKVNYNNNSHVVAIQGFGSIYCYDLDSLKLLPLLEPAYYGERYAADAQSGMIQRLEVWEKYLIGSATDMGAFVFDLSDKESPQAVLPFAEYEISESEFGSLFLLPSTGSVQQALIPNYDIDTDEFMISPLFDSPKALNTNGVNKSARDNRFLIIRETNEARTPIAIDLQSRKMIDLPADVSGKATQEILAWMRECTVVESRESIVESPDRVAENRRSRQN